MERSMVQSRVDAVILLSFFPVAHSSVSVRMKEIFQVSLFYSW